MKINSSTVIAVIWTVYLGSCIYNMASGVQPTWVSVICPATLLAIKCWADVICDKIIASTLEELKEEDNQDR
jgi:hypothetical protein